MVQGSEIITGFGLRVCASHLRTRDLGAETRACRAFRETARSPVLEKEQSVSR